MHKVQNRREIQKLNICELSACTWLIGSLYLYVWRILKFRISVKRGSFKAATQCQFKSPLRLDFLKRLSLTVGVFKLRHSCDHRITHFHAFRCRKCYLYQLTLLQWANQSSRRHWFRPRNLVDPASSHMLVSKIKPCMSQYQHFHS